MKTDIATEAFWAVINETVSDSQQAQLAALEEKLAAKEPNDIVEFDACYRSLLDRAYRWDLWAAAYIINGGCSDDGFDYFRDWLISRGRTVYEAALAAPESLADVSDLDDVNFEDFRYVAGDVFKNQTGKRLLSPPSTVSAPVGTRFDENTVSTLYPRLAKLHGVAEISGSQPKGPSFSSDNALRFEQSLSGLVGKRLTSARVSFHSGSFRPDCEIQLYFDLGRVMLRAKAWTLVLADVEILPMMDFVRANATTSGAPFPHKNDAYSDEQIAALTSDLFVDSQRTRITVLSATRVDTNAVCVTFANFPRCRSITLHGYDDGLSGAVFGVALRQSEETLCLSRLGAEVLNT